MQPLGRGKGDIEILRQPDIAGVHDDEPIVEAVLTAEKVGLPAGNDRVAVGPVVDDMDA